MKPLTITKEMEKALLDAKVREENFFARHGFTYKNEGPKATPAHAAWVKVVEEEYNKHGEEVRVYCDSPMARIMFILGWLKAGGQQ